MNLNKLARAILVLAVLMGLGGALAQNNNAQMQTVLDRMEIGDAVTRILNGVDLLDFAMVRSAFADQVAVDYTSLFGGQASTVSAADLITGWRGTLPGFQSTQHMISNMQITLSGNTATAITYVRAMHYLPTPNQESLWEVAGYYTAGLTRTAQGWRVNSWRLTALWGDGNINLIQLATQRVTAGQGRTVR